MKKFFILLLFSILSVSLEMVADNYTYYRNALIMAYSPVNSIFEDDNIILQIYDGKLWAKNKTGKTIFIDLSRSFLLNNGSSYPLNTSATDETKASKAKQSSSISEYLSIAPATGNDQNETFIASLETNILGKYSTTETPSGDFSEYSKRLLSLVEEITNESLEKDPNGKEYLGTVTKHLMEDESISNIGATIAYAFDKNTKEWTTVTLSTWVSDVIFTPYYTEKPESLTSKQKRGFSVKETDAAKIHFKANTPFEFEEDKSPLIVTDWDGNFKKGTFELQRINIMKGKTKFKQKLIFDGLESDWNKMIKTSYGRTQRTKRIRSY